MRCAFIGFAFALQTIVVVSYSQQVYHFDQSIPVDIGGSALLMPWAGGLNSAQVSTIDLNSDGKDDLAIFDRMADKIFTYLNTGTQYVYAPDYESFFPTDLNEWVLLRDFNCDGKKDMFTSTLGGIKVYVNTTKTGGPLAWREFFPGHPLLTSWNGTINIQVNATDIPAIDDVDEDGDLDVIVAQFVGFGSLEFHKNMSIENTGRCDSLQLSWVTSVWGNFEECNCGEYAFGGTDCSQFPTGRVAHDAGKSLLTIDLTNDGLHDLIFSEQNCTSLYLLPNYGNNTAAKMADFTLFPQSGPSTLLFPAAFYEDLDFDGVKDLVVSTNISARVTTDMDLSNSLWLYKNSGTNAAPQLNLQKKNLLQEKMIDVGSYASPAFADYDNDGDLDLFVSYWAVPDSIASIYLYENSGSFSNPVLNLITNDYLQFSKLGFYNIKIQFIDADGDGRTDLTFTATDKKTAVTQLYFLKNESSQAYDFTGQTPQAVGFQLNQLENVLLYDVNRDGHLDILCGRNDGSLQYYPYLSGDFVVGDLSYLGLNSNITRFCMSPLVVDLHHDGQPDLVLGNKGSIVVYSNFQTDANVVADTILLENDLRENYASRALSSYISLTAADLKAEGRPLIVVGTITGGLHILRADSAAAASDENMVSIWPNPVNQYAKVNFRTTKNSEVQFYNMLGQKLSDPFSVQGGETALMWINFAPGLYLARVSTSGESKTIKVVVR